MRILFVTIVFASYLPPAAIQNRLLKLAALFLSLNALALTISPAVRFRSWDVELRWSHWGGLVIWAAAMYLAHRQFIRHAPDADPYLLPIASLLTGWGLLTIWRLSESFGLRQAAWLAICTGIFVAGIRAPQNLDILRRYKYIFLTSGLLLTALTLVLGANPGGSGPRLWLGCCGIYLQPSEPLKLLLIVYLAAYFAGRNFVNARLLPLLYPTLFLTGLALAILLVQRDLGTASIFIFLYAAIVYMASAKKRLLLISLSVLVGAALIGYFFIDIIQLRIEAWLDPWADPSGRSYQIVQSVLAVANGGLDGRGLGMGAPGLVPVAHSDFIFTSIAEEFGLAGTTALLILLAMLVMRGFLIAVRAGSSFRRLLAAGIAAYFGAQAILIIGGNLRLLPLTGVTLPFVSYGGSSLLTSYLALLILTQISNELDQEPATLPQPGPYLHLAGLLSLGIVACALANGWWATWRSDDLLTRTDNPRRAIADRFVARGNLLDRQNRAITTTQGEIGSYRRLYLVPELSPVTGYTHPIYGQAGLEQTVDPYLRGLQGLPTLQIWFEHLLYGQPPQGLDVRLSLDLEIQAVADAQLGQNAGAVILMNAETGEILAMASHPTYDANLLDENIFSAPNAPLLNRSTQALYPAGEIVTPFLQAQHGTENVSAGERTSLYQKLGFYEKPALRLPAATTRQSTETDILLSPAQLIRGAAALSNQGICPAGQLVMAVDTPTQGWVVLPPLGEAAQCLRTEGMEALMRAETRSFWQYTGSSESAPAQGVTWFMGGTTPGWQGTPLAVVVVLEKNDRPRAQTIGLAVLEAAIR